MLPLGRFHLRRRGVPCLSYSSATQEPCDENPFVRSASPKRRSDFCTCRQRLSQAVWSAVVSTRYRTKDLVQRFSVRDPSLFKVPLACSLDLLRLASDIPPSQRHFFVLFERSNVQVTYVRPRRFGTLTEIETLLRWLQDHPEVHSIILISSQAHLPRIRLCCRFLFSGDLKIYLASHQFNPLARALQIVSPPLRRKPEDPRVLAHANFSARSSAGEFPNSPRSLVALSCLASGFPYCECYNCSNVE